MGNGSGESRTPRTRLPEGVPDSVRAFVRCTSDSLRLDPADASWLPAPPGLPGDAAPEVTAEPGSAPGEFDVSVGWGFVSLSVTVSVSADGQLVVDTSNVPGFLGGDDIDRWVDDVNADLRANGKQLEPLRLDRGAVQLSKQPLAAVGQPASAGAAGVSAGAEPAADGESEDAEPPEESVLGYVDPEPEPAEESVLGYLDGDVGDAAFAGTFGAEAARRRQRQRLLALVAAVGGAAVVAGLVVGLFLRDAADESVEPGTGEPEDAALETTAPEPEPEQTAPADADPELSPSDVETVGASPTLDPAEEEERATMAELSQLFVPRDDVYLRDLDEMYRDRIVEGVERRLYGDSLGDFIYSIEGQTPGNTGPDIDLVSGQLFPLGPGQEASSAEFVDGLGCDPLPGGGVVVCGSAPADPAGYDLFIIRLDGPAPLVPEHTYIYSAVFQATPDTADDWVYQDPFNWDLYQGADTWIRVSTGPELEPAVTAVGVSPAQIPLPYDTATRAVIGDDLIAFFTPRGEVPAGSPFRLTAFRHDGTFEPDASGADVLGADPSEPLFGAP